MYKKYMVNQIIRSGEGEHSATKKNAPIKRKALIYTLGTFSKSVNDIKSLHGIFAEKNKTTKKEEIT